MVILQIIIIVIFGVGLVKVLEFLFLGVEIVIDFIFECVLDQIQEVN